MARNVAEEAVRSRRLRDQPPAMRWYFFGIVTLAAAGLVAMVVLVGWDRIGRTFSEPTVWILLGLILVTDAYPLAPWLRDVRGRVRIHWSAALLSAVLIGFGPATLLAFPVVTYLAVASLGGARWRIYFNLALVMLEGLVAALIMHWLWGSFELAPRPSPGTLLVAGLLVAIAWEAVNLTVIATAQKLSGASWWTSVADGVRKTAMWVAALATAPLVAELAHVAPVMLPVIAVVIVAMHHTVALTTRAGDQARTDTLTGLPNRGAAMTALDVRLGRSEQRQPEVPVMLIDLDGFKAVNDTYGHQAGDELLVQIAGRLRSAIGSDCVVGRMGGDEFLVVGGRFGDPGELARRIHTEVGRPVLLRESAVPGDVQVSVSCSVGYAIGRNGMDSVDLFRQVDRELYRIKNDRPRSASPRTDGPLVQD